MPNTQRSSCSTPKPLSHSAPDLFWAASRCLQVPPHPLDCHRCSDACPADALAFQDRENGVTLQASDACHGCAQCVAACPTEALLSAENVQLIDAQAEGDPLRLGCHRAPCEADMKRMHCLRSLGSDQLAWLSARALPGQVELSMPNACQDCVAGPQSENDHWLEIASVLCRVTNPPSATIYQSPSHALSRRALLLGRTHHTMAVVAADDSTRKARRVHRWLSAGNGLTQPLPMMLTGLALVRDACQGHGVCARVCPTRALEHTPQGELIFNARECLDCGHCLSACPEGALQIGEAGQTSPVVLRQVEQADCFECGRAFAQVERAVPDHSCPACRREKALMQESFHDLFG